MDAGLGADGEAIDLYETFGGLVVKLVFFVIGGQLIGVEGLVGLTAHDGGSANSRAVGEGTHHKCQA